MAVNTCDVWGDPDNSSSIRPTTAGFTLVRLTAEGVAIAADARRLDALLGQPES